MIFLIMTLLYVVCIGETLNNTNNVVKIEGILTDARSANVKFSCPISSKCQEELLVEVSCLSKWCDKKSTVNYNVKKSLININRLQPFTSYRITVSFMNTSRSKEFKTISTAPVTVSELDAYSKNESAIYLRWKPPYPPTGSLEYYQLVYSTEENVSNSLEKDKNISVIPCYLWPDYHCFHLTDLESNKNYSINLRAKNKECEYYGRLTKINVITQKEPSEAPDDLNINWIANDLIVNWKHPIKSNGDIQYFYIKLILEDNEIIFKFIVNVRGSSEQYSHRIDAKYLQPSKRYRLTISAFNGYIGKDAVINVTTYPTQPFADITPKIKYENNKTISVEVLLTKLTKLNENNVNSDRLFLLIQQQNVSNPDPTKLPSLLQNSFLNLTGFQTICESEINHMTTFNFKVDVYNVTLPNWQQNMNVPFETGFVYNVTIVLSRTFENKTKFKVYSKNVHISVPKLVEKIQNNVQNISSQINEASDKRIVRSTIIIQILILITTSTASILLTISLLKSKIRKVFKRNTSEVGIQKDEVPLTNMSDIDPQPQHNILNDELESQHSKNHETFLSNPIEFGDYKEYVEISERNGNFEREYKTFVEKKSKTVYETLDNNLLYEYIDLVYFDGTTIPKAYVACEIPQENNTHNFWRQIWEDNIEFLVLLAEVGSEQFYYQPYWPEEDEKIVHDGISVRLVSSKSYPSYTIRKFILVEDDVIKQATQIHCSYCGANPRKLAPLLRKMLQLTSKTTSSTMVHSSTGIGRVGVFIVCMITMRLFGNEKTIDVLKSVDMLRTWKSGFIRNIEDYKLVYLVISHVLFHHEDSDLNDYANF